VFVFNWYQVLNKQVPVPEAVHEVQVPVQVPVLGMQVQVQVPVPKNCTVLKYRSSTSTSTQYKKTISCFDIMPN